MKKRLLSLIIIFSTICLIVWLSSGKTDKPLMNGLQGTISVSGAWALYPMVIKWGEEFQKEHPGVQIDIAAGGAGKGMADALAQMVDIGMVSRDIYPSEISKGAWSVSVTKDAVVPTVNANNPLLDQLLKKGVTKKALNSIWITETITDWGILTGGTPGYRINVFTRSDACGAASTWANFLGKDQEDLQGIGVYGDPGIAEAVIKDVMGIGYNNINYAFDAKTKAPINGMRVLPIDLNENGVIDKDEDFYKNRETMTQAIRSGLYPSPPARDLHFVCQGRPSSKLVVAFIRWILSKGQSYVSDAGYIELPKERLLEELNKLESSPSQD